jgi:hypothetical protein
MRRRHRVVAGGESFPQHRIPVAEGRRGGVYNADVEALRSDCRRAAAAAVAGLSARRGLDVRQHTKLRAFLRRAGCDGRSYGSGGGLPTGSRTPLSSGTGRLHGGFGDGAPPCGRTRRRFRARIGWRRQLGRQSRDSRGVAQCGRGRRADKISCAVLSRRDGPRG